VQNNNNNNDDMMMMVMMFLSFRVNSCTVTTIIINFHLSYSSYLSCDLEVHIKKKNGP